MPTRSFDVVILGGGNAGMGVTVATREAGLNVAMIEPDLLGGTCPNRGCMPKKVLVAAAQDHDVEATCRHCFVPPEGLLPQGGRCRCRAPAFPRRRRPRAQ